MTVNLRNEAIRKSSVQLVDASFEVMRAAHCRVSSGTFLGDQIASYARVFYCVNGSLVCMINYKPYTIFANQAAISLPGDYISCYTDAPTAEYRLVAFDGHSATERFHAVGLWPNVFNVAQIPTERFDLLFSHLQNSSEASLSKATSIGHDMLAALGEEAGMFAEDKAVFRIQQFFHRFWRDPEINVAAALAHLRISHSSISSRFQHVTGQTLLGYLTCLRLHHACLLLKNSTSKKRSIATACGFSDPAYFSRLFSKELGCTPSRFAKTSPEEYHDLMRKIHCWNHPGIQKTKTEDRRQSSEG